MTTRSHKFTPGADADEQTSEPHFGNVLTRPQPGEVASRRVGSAPVNVGDLSDTTQRGLAAGSSPTGDDNPTEAPDRERFESLENGVSFLRWSSIGFSVLMMSLRIDSLSQSTLVAAGVIFAYFCYRTLHPVKPRLRQRSAQQLFITVSEVGLPLGAICASGLWSSPLLYPLIASVVVIGLAHGRVSAVSSGLAGIGIITALSLSRAGYSQNLGEVSITGAAVLLLAALVAGYGYQLTTSPRQSDYGYSAGLDRLSDANRLLADLHQVAQTLPGSLDREEVLRTSVSRLRNLMNFDSAAIFTIDKQEKRWFTLHQEGMPIDSNIAEQDLPPLAALAARDHQLVRTGESGAEAKRFSKKAQSSMYAPLLARGNLIGLLAIESLQSDAFSYQNGETLKGFVEPVGLAIDNARWFDRIKTVSANEERSRIARDLHDRLGQSLAYLGFELDRLILNHGNGNDVADKLVTLRQDVKTVVGEVRETLYDLRTDVGEHKDLLETIEEFAARLAKRTNLSIAIYSEVTSRLPILQEREMWRITQEALINVERHADASEVNIFWSCHAAEALLEVVDNGRGLQPDHTGRIDSYGILGMRERSSSVGASLELISRPKQGTTVRCSLTRK